MAHTRQKTAQSSCQLLTVTCEPDRWPGLLPPPQKSSNFSDSELGPGTKRLEPHSVREAKPLLREFVSRKTNSIPQALAFGVALTNASEHEQLPTSLRTCYPAFEYIVSRASSSFQALYDGYIHHARFANRGGPDSWPHGPSLGLSFPAKAWPKSPYLNMRETARIRVNNQGKLVALTGCFPTGSSGKVRQPCHRFPRCAMSTIAGQYGNAPEVSCG